MTDCYVLKTFDGFKKTHQAKSNSLTEDDLKLSSSLFEQLSLLSTKIEDPKQKETAGLLRIGKFLVQCSVLFVHTKLCYTPD